MGNIYKKLLITILFLSICTPVFSQNNDSKDDLIGEIGIGIQGTVPGIQLSIAKHKSIGVYAHLYSEKLYNPELEEDFESAINIGLSYTYLIAEGNGAVPYIGYAWKRVDDATLTDIETVNGINVGLKSFFYSDQFGFAFTVGVSPNYDVEFGMSFLKKLNW